jgi:hypothetical protein
VRTIAWYDFYFREDIPSLTGRSKFYFVENFTEYYFSRAFFGGSEGFKQSFDLKIPVATRAKHFMKIELQDRGKKMRKLSENMPDLSLTCHHVPP